MIALIDADSYYCSVEAVFDATLRGRPFVVLSNNDGNVVARSAQAKAIGIAMSAPFHEVAPVLRAHGGAWRSANFTLYADFQRRMLALLARHAEALYPYSIDESFIRFSPGADVANVGAQIRAEVFRHLGLSVSVGIGPSQVLAKAACARAKKGAGVVTFPAARAEADAWLAAMEPEDVWGIATQLGARLRNAGIVTALAIRDMPDTAARRLLTVTGLRIVYELRGTACLPFEEEAPQKKLIACTRAFGRPLTQLEDVRAALVGHVERAAEKLRRQDSVAGTVTVMLGTNPFRTDQIQHLGSLGITLPAPSAFTPDLVAAASEGLSRLFRQGVAYHRVGVLVGEIAPAGGSQLTFASPSPEEEAKRARLMDCLDKLNRGFGRGTVRCAAHGFAGRDAMRSASRSGRYTTRWSELPVALAN